MVDTRSKRPNPAMALSTAKSKKKQRKRKANKSSAQSSTELPENNLPQSPHREGQNNSTNNKHKTTDNVFRSRFPPLELETFEEKLDEWTLTKLQDAIVKQDSRRSKAPREIKDLVKLLRLDFEKRILMVALMAGVPEVVIWNLMGFGKNKMKANPWIRFLSFCVKCLGEALPERDDKDKWISRNQRMADLWKQLSKDEKDIFRDPYFFALAGLPDFNTINEEDNENGDEDNMDDDAVNAQHFDSSIVPPTVHKLSEEEKNKYQPLFDRLVNVDKVHLNHGKPEPTTSVASLQKRSLIAVQKAHQDFAVVCQRNQIAYYLTTASCGGVNGWSRTFSNDMKFADWALKVTHLPDMFTNYVHGKEAVQQIEAKVAQPSDERRRKLGEVLNSMIDVHIPKEIFPKSRDPVGVMKRKGWKVKIVQKEGSLLKPEDLLIGHRKVTGAVVRAWSQDIMDKRFLIEPISDLEDVQPTENNPRNQQPTENTENTENNTNSTTREATSQQKKKHNQTKSKSKGKEKRDIVSDDSNSDGETSDSSTIRSDTSSNRSHKSLSHHSDGSE